MPDLTLQPFPGYAWRTACPCEQYVWTHSWTPTSADAAQSKNCTPALRSQRCASAATMRASPHQDLEGPRPPVVDPHGREPLDHFPRSLEPNLVENSCPTGSDHAWAASDPTNACQIVLETPSTPLQISSWRRRLRHTWARPLPPPHRRGRGRRGRGRGRHDPWAAAKCR